ncbi:MAG: hypothetical protein HBSAPP02_13740 [Phycisphaerae bacterium]|nr:MAG: M28 family peptidase [Planctomycetia bacterium]RIK70658.1 MAG: hypothetical protein DCC66_05100 [Planctomycetota bacterium]GJQ26342.1 MAG: hypothetical protein HBSAPP02_13740 [Phycisphaerae bacterium]
MLNSRRFARIALVLFLAIAVLPARASENAADKRRSDSAALFSEADYLRHVSTLADDSFEGRGTGQEGIDKAAEYIAARFEEWGVQPGGDDHTYFQNFTLKLKSQVAQGTRLAVGMNDRPTRRAATLHEDYIPFPFSSNGSFSGEVVFAGYGIVKDDAGYNDYAGIDVADKIVLVLRRGPKFGDFSVQDSAFRAKASRAAGRDAAALLVVNPADDEEGDKLFDFNAQGTARFGGRGYGIPMIHISRKLADRMLRAGGLGGLEAAQKRIEETQKPASAVLKGVTIRGRVEIEPIESPVRNIIGIVPGTGPQKDEYIVMGAHYDHLGIRNKGTSEFNPEKDISNGADDNASGTTLVMMLARAFASGKPPNRTMVFMLFTGEEMGLLGSAHYANNPTIDLTKVNAMLNFDMVGRLKDNKLEVGGMRTGGFEDLVHRLAEPYGFTIRDGGGGRGPSDHTSFYNKDIPVLFFFTGLHKQYHQPEDDTPLLNIEGAVRIARFGADIVDEIDARSERIVFTQDTSRARISRQDTPDDEPQVATASPADEPERLRLGIVPDMDNDQPGVVIAQVVDGSPAAAAGLKAGDRLMAIGEKRIAGVMDIAGALSAFKWGETARVRIVRDGERKSIDVKFPARAAVAARPAPDRARPDRERRREDARERGPGDADTATAPGSIERSLNELVGRMADLSGGDCTVNIKGQNVDITLTVAARHESDRRLVSQIGRSLDAAVRGDVRIGVSFNLSRGRGQEPSNPLRGPFRDRPGGRRGMQSTADAGEEDMTTRPRRDNRPERPQPPATPAPPRAAGGDPTQKAAKKDPHAHADDEVAAVPMPKVRLGILPTYGESEGRGYEITGVVDDGPAAKAGMKNNDRILKIGGKNVTDVYSYMEALAGYKPGDEVTVVVLRGDREITLTIKSAPQKSLDAD